VLANKDDVNIKANAARRRTLLGEEERGAGTKRDKEREHEEDGSTSCTDRRHNGFVMQVQHGPPIMSVELIRR